MSVAVVSSCYGGIDSLKQPPDQSLEPVEWVMVTDSDSAPDKWTYLFQKRDWVSPRFAAKHAKAQPFDYVGTDIAIWLDTGATIKSAEFVADAVASLGDADVAMWPHPERNNIIDEAAVSTTMNKYGGQFPNHQAAHYVNQGLPDALWATGCIVWRNTPKNVAAGRHWLTEMLRWTLQDQLSWPYVAWNHGLRINPLPQSLWGNRYIQWTGHN